MAIDPEHQDAVISAWQKLYLEKLADLEKKQAAMYEALMNKTIDTSKFQEAMNYVPSQLAKLAGTPPPSFSSTEEGDEDIVGWMKDNNVAGASRRFYYTKAMQEEHKCIIIGVYYDDAHFRFYITDAPDKLFEGNSMTAVGRAWLQDHVDKEIREKYLSKMHPDHLRRLSTDIGNAVNQWRAKWSPNTQKLLWNKNPQPFHDGLNTIIEHPVSGNQTTIQNAIISLNDNHEWSRERVADWLDTLDEQPTYYPTFDEAPEGVRGFARMASYELTTQEGEPEH